VKPFEDTVNIIGILCYNTFLVYILLKKGTIQIEVKIDKTGCV